MKTETKILLLPSLFFLLFIVGLFFFSSKTLAVNSNCVITDIGPNAPQNISPPTVCGGGNQEVIALARKQLGNKYVFGAPPQRGNWLAAGDDPSEFDCSGLVGWAWAKATNGKVNFPGSTGATWGVVSTDKFKTFTPAQKSEIQPGDAIYWTSGNIHHTGLYEGPGNCPSKICIIEAPNRDNPVREIDFEKRINDSDDPWVGFIRPVGY